MKFKYSLKEMNENMAKAYGRDLSISTKKSVEICRSIRGKKLEKAKRFLENVIKMESAVPMRRYNTDTAHKKGIGPGKYPIKTAKGILMVLESAESNAQSKGLSTKDSIIFHIVAHKASRPWHFGRKRRQKMKRTHIEIVLLEKKSHDKKEKIVKEEKVHEEKGKENKK